LFVSSKIKVDVKKAWNMLSGNFFLIEIPNKIISNNMVVSEKKELLEYMAVNNIIAPYDKARTKLMNTQRQNQEKA